MKIGKWNVKDDGIHWEGEVGEYFIGKSRVLENGPGDRAEMYDFMVHLTEKTWLTLEDLFALNSAIVFAANKFNLDFDSRTFSKSLKEQIMLKDLF